MNTNDQEALSKPATNGTATASPETIKFLDLAGLHAPLQDQLDAAWRDALTHSTFVGGPDVEAFESEWADYCGTAACVGVANGTDALELVLSGLGIGPGDEVLVPANTFVATAEAVVNVGAEPTFVDVDSESLLVTARDIESAVTPRTRAVIVVQLYGQLAEMDQICGLAEAAGIHVIEDAAQAHGAMIGGGKAGSFGVAGTYSFYPGKNLGALGDAGAVVTDDLELADRIRTLANHGRGEHLVHNLRGRNSRLDGLQAAALRVKLPQLDAWNQQRRAVHEVYRHRFAGTFIQMLPPALGAGSVHHLEVIRVAERDRLRDRLAAVGVQTGIHYALPCHKQPAFAQFDVRPLPVAEQACRSQLSLPMHPTMLPAEVEAVAGHVNDLL
jgi:dTDP-4-amino-4,6-dideoxygalactose transaminase